MKRAFDICISFLGILFLFPLFVILAIVISVESKGSPLFTQDRVGKNQKKFKIFKFRTMFPMAESLGELTLGDDDDRVTKVGYYLRKYKLDELPQLINVLLGNMSIVGPRPEIPYFTQFYTPDQRKVFSVKPGITDFASIKYRNESQLLAESNDPYRLYLDHILPDKLKLNLEYIENQNLMLDLKIIYLTLYKLLFK